MDKLALLIGRLEKFESDIEKVVMDDLFEHSKDIELMNREQMLDGLDSFGMEIRPRYSEDPYFKSREAADKYATWKMKISPVTKRDRDTPNLYITGFFHSGITAKQRGLEITLNNDTGFGSQVTSKFGTVEGIDPENKKILSEKYAIPKFKIELKKAING